jgi:outer membrane scaffolding protein for murein synthesis (MipA/OmpV family)
MILRMNRRHTRLAILPFLAIFGAVPAAAQEAERQPTAFDGDFLIVGVGATVGPSYEGSDNYIFFPSALVTGRIGGIGIAPRGAGFALDFINDAPNSKITFQLGPVARARLNRTRQIKDPVVKALGELDVAVEVGGNAGFTVNRITNPYDSLTFSIDVRKDVAGAHEGLVVAPTLSFQTPLSQAIFAAAAISAEHVDDDYARYYYTVTPAGNQASGLPTYDARGGWKNVGAGMLVGFDLDGNIANGGMSLFAGANYSRILGNFRRSPIVADRGSPSQFTGAVGIAYTF